MSEPKSIEDKLQIIKARNHGRDSIKDAIVTKQVEAMKYYTPTIEEFHVGFEYEALVDYYKQEFEKFTIDDTDSLRSICSTWDRGEVEYWRVKYLDRSDIESLGYVLHRKDVTMGYDEYCHKRHTR